MPYLTAIFYAIKRHSHVFILCKATTDANWCNILFISFVGSNVISVKTCKSWTIYNLCRVWQLTVLIVEPEQKWYYDLQLPQFSCSNVWLASFWNYIQRSFNDQNVVDTIKQFSIFVKPVSRKGKIASDMLILMHNSYIFLLFQT